MERSVTKIIALDDDPTGSQTVHSCLLLTKWDVETLIEALTDDTSPIFFVLTNTRGMDAIQAATITRNVCHNLKIAIQTIEQSPKYELHVTPIMVSRSDSTLRGHYPIETNVISEELGPFEAHFMVPAFFEGGRITKDSTHYIKGKDDTLIPVHETEFAKDSVFGYSTAYLPDYVEEKTKGTIKATQVERFLLNDVRSDCKDRIRNLHNNVCCVVDCETQDDLNNFANQLKQVASETPEGKKFLFRSGASLLTALAQLPPQPVSPNEMSTYTREEKPGVVIVGSHVQKTTDQLQNLLKLDQVVGVEVDVTKLLNQDDSQQMMTAIMNQISTIHKEEKKHVVIYTSRVELTFDNDQNARIEFGMNVSKYLMKIVQTLPPSIGFLISKGGITSNDVLSVGLELRTCRVVGQILPGCSVVKCPSDHKRYPNLPVVIFPGNVGDETSLSIALQRLST